MAWSFMESFDNNRNRIDKPWQWYAICNNHFEASTDPFDIDIYFL